MAGYSEEADDEDDRGDSISTLVLPGVEVLLVSGPESVADYMSGDPDVAEVVVADGGFASAPKGNTTGGVSTPWHLKTADIPVAKSKGLSGQGVLIGIVDTGIDISHPEFDPARISFAQFGKGGGKLRSRARDRDPASHGTHVSSIVAGKSVGVAPQAEMAVASVFGKDMSASFASVIGALDWMLTIQFGGRQDPGVDVINMSVVTEDRRGHASYNPSLRKVVLKVRSFGIAVIAAIGNSGAGSHGSPGNYAEAIGVGAVDRAMSEWHRSCGGAVPPPENCDKPDLLAAGVDIYSAMGGGGYLAKTGTSFAAPVATGVAALICEERKGRSLVDSELRSRAKVRQPGQPKVVSF
jgi:subtilisin family serine protease